MKDSIKTKNIYDENKINDEFYKERIGTINIKFSKIEEYKEWIIITISKKINISYININVWEKFNFYTLTKYTKENKESYEKLFYQVLYYFNEYRDIELVQERWKDIYLLKNDISFFFRYSENLLRYKNCFGKFLRYDKCKDYNEIKVILDNKFNNILNKKKEYAELNMPSTLLDIDFDFDLISSDFSSSEYTKFKKEKNITSKKIIEKNKNENKVKISDNVSENMKVELNDLIKDMDDFEI